MFYVLIDMMGGIAESTPAFKAYALSILLAQSNFLADKWHLDIDRPITTNELSHFVARPMTNGPATEALVANHYLFSVYGGGFDVFEDRRYSSKTAQADENKCAEFARITNLMTTNEAVALVREKLNAIGVNSQIIETEPSIAQWFWNSNDVRLPMPNYLVSWDTDEHTLVVEVSAIITNVVAFTQRNGVEKLKVNPPTNYLSLLDLPNDTILVDYRQIAPAYQRAVSRSMLEDMNRRIELLKLFRLDTLHPETTRAYGISHPSLGHFGSLKTPTHVFNYPDGKLQFITRIGVFPDDGNFAGFFRELAKSPSLIDTNEAYTIALRIMELMNVDVEMLNQKHPPIVEQMSYVDSLNAEKLTNERLANASRVLLPIFNIHWGSEGNVGKVQILGHTKEPILARMEDASFINSSRLYVTNIAELVAESTVKVPNSSQSPLKKQLIERR